MHIPNGFNMAILGAVAGTAIIFLSAWGVAKLLVRRIPEKVLAEAGL